MSKVGWRDSSGVRAVSFGCFGTLIDAEAGMIRVLEDEGILEALPVPVAELLACREEKEREWQSAPYRHYREILSLSIQEAVRHFECRIDEAAAYRFADSIQFWRPYPDTLSALRRLGSYWPMAVISNAERGPLMRSVDNLGVPFAEMVSAEDVRSYKPSPSHFEQMRTRLGERAEGQVHVASSLHHDVRPAIEQGIPVIWVNRTGEKVPRSLGAKAVKSSLLEVCDEFGV